MVTIATAPSLAKETGISTGVDRVYFNREGRENKHYYSKPTTVVGKAHANI